MCTTTRSPCEDQALPLSWAPSSSAEDGKSPQGQPCCRLQWLRLSTFSAADRLTEFFRELGHLQMPAEEQRSGGPAFRCARRPDVPPLKRGLGGLRQVIRCRAGVGGQGKPLRRWKATAAMESHAEMARAAARSPREDQALSLVFYWDSVPNPDAPRGLFVLHVFAAANTRTRSVV